MPLGPAMWKMDASHRPRIIRVLPRLATGLATRRLFPRLCFKKSPLAGRLPAQITCADLVTASVTGCFHRLGKNATSLSSCPVRLLAVVCWLLESFFLSALRAFQILVLTP